LAPEAVEGFTAIWQPSVAVVVQRAVVMLGSPFKRERAARWSALGSLGGDPSGESSPTESRRYRNIPLFRPLENEFYSLLRNEAGGFESAADSYADRIAAHNHSEPRQEDTLATFARDVCSKGQTGQVKAQLASLKDEIAKMRQRLAETRATRTARVDGQTTKHNQEALSCCKPPF
jgi:hypothetical protein